MRLFLFNLLLVVMLAMPGQSLALCLLSSGCGCGHGEQTEAAETDHAAPCCPKMARAADEALTGLEAPSQGCCCSVERDSGPSVVEPTLTRLELSEDDAPVPAPAVLLAPSGFDFSSLRAPTRVAASPGAPRAPPLRAGRSRHVLNCVWRS